MKDINAEEKRDPQGADEIRLSFMLFAMLTTLAVSPLIRELTAFKIIWDITFTLIFVSGCYAVVHDRLLTALSILFAVPLLYSSWAKHFAFLPEAPLAGNLSGICFCVVIIMAIITHIKSTRQVTVALIEGALSIYLLLGFAWALLYSILNLQFPGCFAGMENVPEDSSFHALLYFSFVTLSTLGYGDIVPTRDITRSLALLEAIVGQIYLVVVVAWLVGIKVAQDIATKGQSRM